MEKTVRIAASALDAIVAHARREAPHECCGLLVGRDAEIDEAVPTRNADASPTRYRVDPADHFALIRRLRGTSRAIVGAYHSHPNSGATPSVTDVAEAYSRELVYVIVSLQDRQRPDVRAFSMADDGAKELSLTVG